MEAGYDLDALVAAQVFGIAPIYRAAPYPQNVYTAGRDWIDAGEPYTIGADHLAYDLPHYSTDMGAAYQVLEHFTDANIEKAGGVYEVWLNAGHSREASLPHAICLAALDFVGRKAG